MVYCIIFKLESKLQASIFIVLKVIKLAACQKNTAYYQT